MRLERFRAGFAAWRSADLVMGRPKTRFFGRKMRLYSDHLRLRRFPRAQPSQNGKNLRVNPIASNFLAFFFKIHSSSTFPAECEIREKEIVAASTDRSPDPRARTLESFLPSSFLLITRK